jgi:DNA-binding HxlR family transcriptional regulator
MHMLEGRWKVALIMKIQENVTRFGKLKAALPGISEKMLAQQLRELEQDELICKTIYPEIPPRTEYALTAKGEELHVLLQGMCDWGIRHIAPATEQIITTIN